MYIALILMIIISQFPPSLSIRRADHQLLALQRPLLKRHQAGFQAPAPLLQLFQMRAQSALGACVPECAALEDPLQQLVPALLGWPA